MTRKPMNYWAGTAEELAQCYPESDSNDSHGYIRISRNNVIIGMHVWIWKELKGPIPDGWEIDHINGVRTDNRLNNLRCIPKGEQRRNAAKRSDNLSGVQGVSLWETTRRGDQQVLMWRAVAHDQSGKQVIRTFSVNKYGYEEAFRLACVKRKQMEKDYEYHPNHGR